MGNDVLLPDYVSKNQAFLNLGKNLGKHYSDQKCFFRCLAFHVGTNIAGLEKKTNQLLTVMKLFKEFLLRI